MTRRLPKEDFLSRALFTRILFVPAALTFASAIPGSGVAAQSLPPDFPEPEELRMLSIEDLANLTITTPARRPERVRVTPAAVAVVTREDIHRTGAPSVPASLRLATGVHVARVDGMARAISIRGFNNSLANKLLVVQDGRSLYSPLFSGVFWDVQNPLMEDVERIEVVRGPGSTLWGANAMNGVINIITRDAADTQGTFLSIGRGNREEGFAAARYGGQAGEHTWYRVYGQGWEREGIVRLGDFPEKRQRFSQGGFRVDSRPTPDVSWTFQGDIYSGQFDPFVDDPVNASGANLLGRWTYSAQPGSHFSVQTYYDRVERNIPDLFGEERDTFDIRFQHRVPVADRHDLLWGAEYRISTDDIENSPSIAFNPSRKNVRIASGFIQDKITLLPNLLELTVGSKFEENEYTGFEFQPSVRLAWIPTDKQTVWLSVSRATRTPSRVDTEARLTDPETGALTLRGDPDFLSERLVAYEAGYRVLPIAPLSLDFAVFYNKYDRLRSIEGSDPAVLSNRLEGETYGLEISTNYQVSNWWRLSSGYAFLNKELRATAGSTDDPDARGAEGNDPDHILFVHSAIDLGDQWTFDTVARHVSSLPNPEVPAYTELDMRLACRLSDEMEVSLVGRNLIDSEHREFGTSHAVPRSLFFRIEWNL